MQFYDSRVVIYNHGTCRISTQSLFSVTALQWCTAKFIRKVIPLYSILFGLFISLSEEHIPKHNWAHVRSFRHFITNHVYETLVNCIYPQISLSCEWITDLFKHLQNFNHPSNHLIPSSKILKWYKMVQKFYQGSKVFEPQKFLFFKNFRIFAKFSRNFGKKFEILQQRQNETFFLLRLGNFRVLVEKFFSVLYHRLIDLEILQESRFISSSE